MNIRRIATHFLTTHWQVNRAFPLSSLDAIEQAIRESKASHVGEIRFAVEGALHSTPLFRGQSARERAIDLFSQLRVWDTEHNNGVLIYLLLADGAVEVLADRGIYAKVHSHAWEHLCRTMESAFKQKKFQEGVVSGIHAVTQHLVRHFPAQNAGPRELIDRPAII